MTYKMNESASNPVTFRAPSLSVPLVVSGLVIGVLFENLSTVAVVMVVLGLSGIVVPLLAFLVFSGASRVSASAPSQKMRAMLESKTGALSSVKEKFSAETKTKDFIHNA